MFTSMSFQNTKQREYFAHLIEAVSICSNVFALKINKTTP